MIGQAVIPYLVVDGAADAIAFYERAFGAEVVTRMDMPDGNVAHASLNFGGSQVMLSDPFEQAPYKPPAGAPSGGIYLYVDDVDAVYQQAVDAGATASAPIEDMFWGDRWGRVEDPFGHVWEIATRKEEVTPEEMDRRAQDMFGQMAG
jgi:PhnB protein